MPPKPERTWKNRVLAEARAREEELAETLAPVLAELEEVREVISLLSGGWKDAVRGGPPVEQPPEPQGAAETPEEEKPRVKPGKKPSGGSNVPTELRMMPAVRGRTGVRSPQLRAARIQLDLYTAAREAGDFIVAEIAPEKVRPGSQAAARHLRSLEADGLLVRTGRNRRKKGGVGRASPEYRVPQPYEPTTEEVRDLITKSGLRQERCFTADQAVEAAGGFWSVSVASSRLALLRKQGIVSERGAGIWCHEERADVTGPAERNPGNGDGPRAAEPVPGTGRGKAASRKDVRDLLDAAKAQGAIVARGGKHPAVEFRGQKVSFGGTPSYHGLKDARASLRRIGLEV